MTSNTLLGLEDLLAAQEAASAKPRPTATARTLNPAALLEVVGIKLAEQRSQITALEKRIAALEEIREQRTRPQCRK